MMLLHTYYETVSPVTDHPVVTVVQRLCNGRCMYAQQKRSVTAVSMYVILQSEL
jgi:hypothetical protein